MANIDYLLSDINNINGIGSKTAKLLRRKNITTIFDLLWNLPRDFVDRTKTYKISELEKLLSIDDDTLYRFYNNQIEKIKGINPDFLKLYKSHKYKK